MFKRVCTVILILATTVTLFGVAMTGNSGLVMAFIGLAIATGCFVKGY